MPTVTMYGLDDPAGKPRISPAPTAIAASRRIGPGQRVDSESLRKSTSEEPMGPHGQRGEQREVEHGLRPGGPERDLEQAHRHAEHHRGDRGSRHTAEPPDDDDRHQRAYPVPVQR